MKICPVRAELFQEDGRTDRQTEITKLIVTFLQFRKPPTKGMNGSGKKKF